MSAALEALEGRLAVSGRMTLDSARALLEAGAARMAEQDWVVDLAGVEAVDSSALAVLFGWMREAARAGRRLSVAHLPAQLASLADLYGVTDVLPEGATGL